MMVEGTTEMKKVKSSLSTTTASADIAVAVPISTSTTTPSTVGTKATVSTYDMTIHSAAATGTATPLSSSMATQSNTNRRRGNHTFDGGRMNSAVNTDSNRNVGNGSGDLNYNDDSTTAAQDILARWKREKLEQQQQHQQHQHQHQQQHHQQQHQQQRPMKDITNMTSFTSCRMKAENRLHRRHNYQKQQHQQQQQQQQQQQKPSQSQSFQQEYSQDDESGDDLESNTTSMNNQMRGQSSSVMTSPTANTALNQVGIDRLLNRKNITNDAHENRNNHIGGRYDSNENVIGTNGENNHGVGVRLFSNSISGSNNNNNATTTTTTTLPPRVISSRVRKDATSSSSSSSQSQSPDVSLITQDTDMTMMLNGIIDELDANENMNQNHNNDDAVLKAVDKARGKRGDGNTPCTSAPALSNNFSINDKSRCSNNNINNNNEGVHNMRPRRNIDFANKMCNNKHDNESVAAIQSLQLALDKSRTIRLEQEDIINEQNVELSRLSAENTSVVKELEDFRSTLVKSSMLICKEVKNLQLNVMGTGGVDKSLGIGLSERPDQDYNGKQRSIIEALKLIEQLAREDVPALMKNISSKRGELETLQSSINERGYDLEQTLSFLKSSKQEEQKQQLALSKLTGAISSKQMELSDIQCLCDEKVQSVHEMERKANLVINESEKRKSEINSIQRSLKLEREQFQTAKQQFDNDRAAWEAQIQLKHDKIEAESKKIEEDRKEILLLGKSLDSNREELEQRSKNISAVQDTLLNMEASLDDKEKMLLGKEAELNEQFSQLEMDQNDMQLALEEHDQSCLSLKEERREFEEEHAKFLTRLSEFEKEIGLVEHEKQNLIESKTVLQKEQKELEDKHEKLSARLFAFEKDCKDLEDEREIFFKQSSDFERARNEFDEEREKFEERVAKFEEESRSFADDREKFIERISAFEDNEAELNSTKHLFNNKLSKFKNSVKLAKEDAAKKKSELMKLHEELKVKEKDLDRRMKVCLQNEGRIAKMQEDLKSKEYLLDKDRIEFDRSVNNEKSVLNDTISRRMKEESFLDVLMKKREGAEKALNSINNETRKIRDTIQKKIQNAQIEIASMKKECDKWQSEIDLFEERKQVLMKDISEGEKAKNILNQTLKVKESVLQRIERGINDERDSWEESICTQRSRLENELNKQRKEAKDKIKRMQENASSAMTRLSKQLHTKHEKACNDLNERAHQVELLHEQLTKVVERTKNERRNIEDGNLAKIALIKELEGCRVKVQQKEKEILSLSETKQKVEHQLLEVQICLEDTKIESSKRLEDLSNQLRTLLEDTQEKKKKMDELKKDLNIRSESISKKEESMKIAIEKSSEELSQQRELIETEKLRLSKLSKEMETQNSNIKRQNEKLMNKQSSLVESERKLKEYAQLLKKQGREIKQKEKDLQNAAKLLSQQKDRKSSQDNEIINDLRKRIEEEQNQFRHLSETHSKLRKEITAKEEIIYQLQSAQENSNMSESRQKLNELARQLMEKDEQIKQEAIELEEKIQERDQLLTRENLELEAKWSKCHECEARLAVWQKELETLSARLQE